MIKCIRININYSRECIDVKYALDYESNINYILLLVQNVCMHVGMDKTDPVELNRTNQTDFSAFGQIISGIWVKLDKNRVKMGVQIGL
jgi:hypothetical protein